MGTLSASLQRINFISREYFAPSKFIIGGCICLLSIICALSFRQVVLVGDGDSREQHTFSMMADIKDLGSAFHDAQTGQLGYLLTGLPVDLAAYNAALKRLPVLSDSLRLLDTDNRSQQQEIGALELLVQQTLNELSRAIQLRTDLGEGSTQPAAIDNGGIRLTGQIETMLDGMWIEQTRLLVERRTAINRNEAVVDWLSIVGALAAAAFLASAGLMRRRAMTPMHESDKDFRLLTEHASDMVSRVGPDGMQLYVSPAAKNIFGLPPEALVGRDLQDFVLPEDRSDLKAMTTCLLAGLAEEGTAAFRVSRPDGKEVWVEETARLLRNPATGGSDGYVAISRDVTQRRQLDRERETRRQELEEINSRLNQLSRHLSHARDRAEQASQAKTRFLAGMSHELRTPLNGILGYARLLRMEGELNPKQMGRVDAMLGAGHHLLEMINRVLNLSEIEAERFELKVTEVDLLQITEVCIDLVRPAAEEKGLSLDLIIAPDAPRYALADPARLRQIVLNLLGNAVKYTVQGAVELRFLVSDGSVLRIEVADTGPGIKSEQRHQLFQDFERLNAGAGSVEGAGLGLAISGRLVALMGGRIGHDDNPGGGSLFWFELPVAATAKGVVVATIPDPLPRLTRSMRLLVVDDLAMNRDLTGSLLRAAGHDVTCVESGMEGIAAAASGNYDAVLMDVRMPGMDGLEATRCIRRLTGVRAHVPIIGLTAQAFAEQIAECRNAGMNDHIAKPFSLDALLDTVTQAVSDREALAGVEPTGHETTRADVATPDADIVSHMPLAAPLAAAMIEPDLSLCDSAIFESIAAIFTPEAVKTHLETIITRSGNLLCRLRQQSLPEADASELAESAHTLAGSAGMFGFKRLALASRCYERAVETDAGETPALVEALIAALETTLPELEREAAQASREALPDTETAMPFSPQVLELRIAASQSAHPVPVRTEIQSGTPSLTDAISAVKRDFAAEVANTSELILEAQRLRYQVYCVERGFIKSDNGIEQDKFDVHSRHIVLRRHSDGEITGTTRVVLYDPDAPEDSYPMQRVCAASLLHGLPMTTTAELSRFAISKQLRGSSPALIRLALIEGLFRISHELGLTDWCAVMENSLLRLLKSSAIHFRPLGPLVEYHGLRQPCCANIKEIALRMQVERPEIWAFVTHNGHYYGSKPDVIRFEKPHNIASDWRATVSKSSEFAFFPSFESAVINTDAPPQYYRPLAPAHHGSLVAALAVP